MTVASASHCARPSGKTRAVFVPAILFLAGFLVMLPSPSLALPSRLVLALDGVAYRDMVALQAGITRTNSWGHQYELRAFTTNEGYYPVSRMISTFPSTSDVAWTDIFGDRPLPGYQRTYYSARANSMIELNGVTSTMEHEHQMDWQVQNGFVRAMGYLCPAHTLLYEMKGLEVYFWRATQQNGTFYAYFRATDDCQHLDRDIIKQLCKLDLRLQKLRAQYQARTGHDLQIVILSDHGHNHAGRGIRVKDTEFLTQAGYHVSTSINGPRDVVLPIVGIESWIEVHCQPSESEKLAKLLCHLKGTDVLAATVPGRTNEFLVMNAHGERANVWWQPARNAFRYDPVNGDPLNYQPVLEALAQSHQLDAEGFASAQDWMAATMTNHYPLAPERIVRGLTHCALNPATILVSLDNRYVNDWLWTDLGSRLVTCRSTHGGLDDICSDGILMSNFKPTYDTSTDRVASQFENFYGVKNFRAEQDGAELVTKREQTLARVSRDPFDHALQQLLSNTIYLRVWSPQLTWLNVATPITVAIEKVPHYSTSPAPLEITFDHPVQLPKDGANERIYPLPAGLKLEPSSEYTMSGWIQNDPRSGKLFELSFHTGDNGQPVAF